MRGIGIHIIHKGEVLLCTSRKAFLYFEGKVDVQKGGLRYREIFDNRCVSFIQFTFLSNIVMWSQSLMATMFVLVRVQIWVTRGFGAFMGLLELCSPDCG